MVGCAAPLGEMMSKTDVSSEEKLLSDIRDRFIRVAGEDGSVDQDELASALSLRDPYYARRLFQMVDSDNSGEIDADEFIGFVRGIMSGSDDEKLQFAFRLHDPDDSGTIEPAELRQILESSLAQHGASLPDEAVENLTDALFRRADEDGNGSISFDEFKAVLDAYPKLKKQMTFSAATWLRPARPAARKSPGIGDWLRTQWQGARNDPLAAWFLVVYAVVNVGLFWNAVDTYRDAGANIYVQIARGCGACLNFNGALILVPMLRHLLTRVRASVLGELIPVDHAIAFHKLVGHTMLVFAVIHTAAHLINYSTLTGGIPEYLFGTTAGLTGLILMLVFFVMWICALDFIRRGGHFELFYITHMGYFAWFALCLVHGPVFWIWAGVPILGYLIERVVRFRNTRRAFQVSGLDPLPSSVTRVEMQLPDKFRYKPGDYVFIKYPPVSKHEWHPFTVTSCPEETGILSVHVRGLGNWTKKLHAYAKSLKKEDEKGAAFIDGPYGTPSIQIFQSEVAVMIGAGIGVTPFAAILKSIFERRETAAGDLKVKKSYFMWMNRDQYAFEWFSDMLCGLEARDPDASFLDARVFLTGVKVDMTSATLDIALDVHQEETGRDLFTGLRNRTVLDRPNWKSEFQRIAKENEGRKVTVFFCGPAPLAKMLAKEAAANGFGFHKENF